MRGACVALVIHESQLAVHQRLQYLELVQQLMLVHIDVFKVMLVVW